MRFLHASDLHLGKAFLGMPPERARERREDLKQVLRNIVLQANDHAVDLLILAGNLFDSPEPPTPLVDFVSYTLRPEAFHRPTTVLIVAGEADALRAESPYMTAELPKNFAVVKSTDWTEVKTGLGGVRILAASTDGSDRDRNVVGALAAVAGRVATDDVPTLAVAHASWDAPGFESGRFQPFSDEDVHALAGIEYLALGRSHEVRQVANHPLAYYPGAPEPIFPDQANMDTCVLVGELAGRGSVTVKPVAVNVRDLRHIDLDATPFRRDADVVEALRKLADRRCVLRLRLHGSPAPEYSPDLDHIEAELAPLFFSVEITAALDLPAVDFTPGTIHGEFIARLQREIATLPADRAAEAEVLRAALRFGATALLGKDL